MAQLRTIPLAIAAMGLTVDGREISEKDIDDIVATYNYKKYGARINLDHEFNWSGWAAKNLLNVDIKGGMLGDVIELTTAKNDEGIKVLYAVLSPNASFVQLNQADQAVYFSIEINRDFMKSGQTYLTGLAVTDYPASTYTDRIHFSQKDKADNTHAAHTNVNSTPSDTDLLKVSLALDEAAKPTKSLFKKLFNFNKDDDDMKREEFAAAMTDALGAPLLQFSQALEANTLATQALLAKQGTTTALVDDANTDNLTDTSTDKPTAAFSALDGKVDSLVGQIEALTKTVSDAIKDPASTTTEGEEEHLGENGKYHNLL
ncbi:predicted capsid scaffolding protein [Moritella sp. PE36]|uniref:GPO family capsid scaffolding protein n=1 Tax=Moritella sp. PE36 TaxID=58051 RepID=UPI0001568B8E|nr:GPO family capsid scaffolding protein [Moritella sp. PE36]EDM65070.1 predicted capsid scaffolding protein [Moritella sp. PE36]